jgi:hypothetical protein
MSCRKSVNHSHHGPPGIVPDATTIWERERERDNDDDDDERESLPAKKKKKQEIPGQQATQALNRRSHKMAAMVRIGMMTMMTMMTMQWTRIGTTIMDE